MRNRRRRRRQNQQAHHCFGRKDGLLFIFVSYLSFPQTTCNGTDGSSFRYSPPPPPPPQSLPPRRSFASSTTTRSNDNGINDGNKDRHTQHYASSSSSLSSQNHQISSSQPIHYEFPIASDGINERIGSKTTTYDGTSFDNNDDLKKLISARDDLVTRYWSRKIWKFQIQSSIALIGYALGTFVAKSLIGGNEVVKWTGNSCALLLVISTWFRTPLGELARAVGLSIIIVLQRTQQIRSNYPTWRYVAASIGLTRRGGGGRDANGRPIPRRGPRPFPPARNPWRYVPRSSRDPDFNMIYALISMALVGSVVGSNMPFIPSWIGALVGSSAFALACTWQDSPRGDLARSCAMRVVAAFTELWKIQADLQIIPKATVVSSQIIDKAMILDRKHRVKDRFLSLASKGYESASKMAEQIQEQQRNRGGADNIRKNNSRDDDDRRNNDDDGRDRRYRSYGGSAGLNEEVYYNRAEQRTGRQLERLRDEEDYRQQISSKPFQNNVYEYDTRGYDDEERLEREKKKPKRFSFRRQ